MGEGAAVAVLLGVAERQRRQGTQHRLDVVHADAMPDVVGPDGLESELALWQKYAHRLPELTRSRALAERPIELRPVDPINPFSPEKRPPDHAVWMRAAGPSCPSATFTPPPRFARSAMT